MSLPGEESLLQIKEAKRALRAEALIRRGALGEEERRKKDDQIRRRLFALPAWKEAPALLIYLSYDTEPDTWEIAKEALQRGIPVYCPRIEDSRLHHMEFYRLRDLDDTIPGFRGIREPGGTERYLGGEALLLQPGVVFNLNMDRIGYGGGYYDRFLAAPGRKDDLKNRVAICYDCQVISKDPAGGFPVDQTDIRPTCLITETRSFGQDLFL